MNANRDRLTSFYSSLRGGYTPTAKQIAHRFRVANPRDLVYRLRENGITVFLDEVANSKGVIRRRYRLSSEHVS
jgi:hypothetical protein